MLNLIKIKDPMRGHDPKFGNQCIRAQRLIEIYVTLHRLIDVNNFLFCF